MAATEPATVIPRWRRWWWCCWYTLSFLWFVLCYRWRCYGTDRLPRTGPMLLVSNHQSFFDPIIVGLGLNARPFFALARSTLWRNRPLGWMIASLNGIPIDRCEQDLGSLRRCLAVLGAGHRLLMFPEGTRTPDRAVRRLAPGLMLLIRRSQVPVVPVALEGAFDVWPRTRKLPRLTGRVAVMYGEPIPARTLVAMGPEAGLEHLRQTIETMRQELEERMARQRPIGLPA